MQTSRDIGDRESVVLGHLLLGRIATRQGDYGAAREHLHASLVEARDVGTVPHWFRVLAAVADLKAETGAGLEAAELLGLLVTNPAQDPEMGIMTDPVLERLHQLLPAETLAAALERGRALDVETTIVTTLRELVPEQASGRSDPAGRARHRKGERT
jgi:hypothetical protein